MKSIPPEALVYLWLGATDMRCSFDRLAELAAMKLSKSVVSSESFFIFLSRCRSRVKILYWDKDGYALWHKRLSAGVFRVENKDGVEELSGVDLLSLLSGVDLARIKLQKSAEKGLYSSI